MTTTKTRQPICENCGERNPRKAVRIARGTYEGCRCCSKKCARELVSGGGLSFAAESAWERSQMGLNGD
jgi:hypothetical protein